MENHRLAMNQKLLYAGEVQIVGMSENRVLLLVYPMISLIIINISIVVGYNSPCVHHSSLFCCLYELVSSGFSAFSLQK
jgi:hypothetical protein